MGIPIFILLVGAVIYLLLRPALLARRAREQDEQGAAPDASGHDILRLEDYPRRPRRKDDTIPGQDDTQG